MRRPVRFVTSAQKDERFARRAAKAAVAACGACGIALHTIRFTTWNGQARCYTCSRTGDNR